VGRLSLRFQGNSPFLFRAAIGALAPLESPKGEGSSETESLPLRHFQSAKIDCGIRRWLFSKDNICKPKGNKGVFKRSRRS
jgi:hypothetical protein